LSKLKKPRRYLEIDPWRITEKGFHPEHSRVSESVFSLANEFMGIRGHFDEGYSGDTLTGSYFNGVFTEHPHVYPLLHKGFPERNHFMVNAVNWLYTRITIGGEQLDLASARIDEFERTLDLRSGLLVRSFVWETGKGKHLRVRFERLLSMSRPNLGCQRVVLEPLDFSGKVSITLALDFSPPHESAKRNFWSCPKKSRKGQFHVMLGEVDGSGHRILSAFRYRSTNSPAKELSFEDANGKLFGVKLEFAISKSEPLVLDRMTTHYVERNRATSAHDVWNKGLAAARDLADVTFDQAREEQASYWKDVWNHFAVTIEGDPAYEQGLRYCIYQLLSTYHGVDPRLNVGAKGLTGEAYGGLAFWDTETYCLPFYIFTNPSAARNLLLFRYNTLPQARERARQLGCKGARYPMTTIDGTETCGVWYHGDLEIHVPAAVAYGVWQYVHVTGDTDFLHQHGLEMLVEISRFYASHGGWSPKTGEFGLWGVMGPDEFHMMVHNNAYTNAMARKTFEWTLDAMKEMKRSKPRAFSALARKLSLREEEPRQWKKMAAKMRLQRNAKGALIEQHDGFFDLPHVDLAKLPASQKPVYTKFPYIARSRYDWIKQPDVLLLLFFFSREYSVREKRENFEFYEPRCTHESSLSPGIHSILATELGKHELAFDYVRYAARLDLDDYNGNTSQGLHMTSMAASWMSLVYGFAGLRTDGPLLSFRPSLPKKWKAYSFRLTCQGALIEVRVNRTESSFRLLEGSAIDVEIYGKPRSITNQPFVTPLPKGSSQN
jgi:maltose phosphorylase